jgi:hypothetical protein
MSLLKSLTNKPSRYLLDNLSGPFLQKNQALIDLTSACVECTISALDLIDPKFDQAQRYTSVATGLHDLHRYAVANWVPHLEDLAEEIHDAKTLENTRLPYLFGHLYRRYDALKALVPPLCSMSTRSQSTLTRNSDLNNVLPGLGILTQLYWTDSNSIGELAREAGNEILSLLEEVKKQWLTNQSKRRST